MATAMVAFVSQKGGVGKSTLARALAAVAAGAGQSVCIADLDTQQATVTNWAKTREKNRHEPRIEVRQFGSAAEALGCDDFDLLIVDAPARASVGTLEIARRADLVVQPTRASVDDLHPAIIVFHELIGQGIPKSKLAIALFQIATPAEEIAAREYVSKAGYEVLPGMLPDRPAYRQLQNIGLAVTETKSATPLEKNTGELIAAIMARVRKGAKSRPGQARA